MNKHENRFWWWIRRPLRYTLRDIWWWILHRTTHRFNIVKIKSLAPGYYDVDTRILHSSFDLLIEFVEKEKPFDFIDWDHDDGHRHAAAEIKDLYNWWKNVRPARRTPLDDFDDEMRPPALSFGHTDEYPAYKMAMLKSWELDQQWDEEDTNNLIRLTKIRGYLWT